MTKDELLADLKAQLAAIHILVVQAYDRDPLGNLKNALIDAAVAVTGGEVVDPLADRVIVTRQKTL